jgi:K+:H+ antiporter
MQCSHLGLVRTDRPRSKGCEECLKMGDTWVHLRLCRTCGHVGCTSLEPGEGWSWCYVDEVAMELK